MMDEMCDMAVYSIAAFASDFSWWLFRTHLNGTTPGPREVPVRSSSSSDRPRPQTTEAAFCQDLEGDRSQWSNPARP